MFAPRGTFTARQSRRERGRHYHERMAESFDVLVDLAGTAGGTIGRPT